MQAWARHEYDDAISYYLGKRIPPSPAMELGDLKHKEWAAHIERTKTIPDELGGGKLRDPIIEQFFGVTLPFSDKYQIHVISRIDLFDQSVIRDWKCGKSKPSTHLSADRATQLDMYQLTLEANGHKPTEGRIVCFNPYTRKVETGIQYLNEQTKERALNFIMTIGGEMIPHLEAEGLLKNYDPDWRNKPASLRQVGYMRSLGITVPDGVTAAQASELIDKAKKAAA